MQRMRGGAELRNARKLVKNGLPYDQFPDRGALGLRQPDLGQVCAGVLNG